MGENANDKPRTGRCPVCQAPVTYDVMPGERTELEGGAATRRGAMTRFRPFCSRTCADVDLLRWLRGAYAIPGKGADDDEDGEASQSLRGTGGQDEDGDR